MRAAGTFYYSKGFRQPCLPENGIGGMTARDADRDWKIALRDRAVPNLMATSSLTHHGAASGPQQFVQRANTVLLLGILWGALAACVIGALAYDIAYWLEGW